MKRQFAKIALLSAITLVVFALFSAVQYQKIIPVQSPTSHVDLSGYDLSKETVRIDHSRDTYPNHLYTPQDFAVGRTTRPSKELPARHTTVDYGTHAITLTLPRGKTYGITGMSVHYSQAVYINGKLAGSIGHPADNKGDTIPGNRAYTYYFAPHTNTTQIIYQYANFNHKEGSGAFPLYVSEAPNIQRLNEKRVASSALVAGCLLTVFVFYLGMFTLHKTRRYYLYFALACLSIAVYGLFTGEKIVMDFLPNLNWYFALATEYLALLSIAVTFTAYLAALLPQAINVLVRRIFYAISATYAIIILVTRPLFYTHFMAPYQLVLLAFALYVIVCLIRSLKARRFDTTLVFVGALVFVVGVVVDSVLYSFFPAWFHVVNISQMAMLLCVYLNMIALASRLSYTEDRLALTQAQKEELEQTNRELIDRFNDLMTRLSQNPQQKVAYGPLRLDFSLMRAYLNDRDLLLRPREFALLAFFVTHPNQGFTAAEIYESVWGQLSNGNVSTVKTHISQLRKKLDAQMNNPFTIDLEKRTHYVWRTK